MAGSTLASPTVRAPAALPRARPFSPGREAWRRFRRHRLAVASVAILANDTPVIMAVTFVLSCLVVLFNLIADVLYGWLDPRITLG